MKPFTITTIITALIWLSLTSIALAGDIRISAHVDQQEVYLGQVLTLTISVEGADDVSQPQLLKFANFKTQFIGQSQNSSTFITNGHRTSSTTIELSYSLTPLDKSSTAIPPVTVIADGAPYTTNAIPISIKQPEENEYFKLEVRLSKPTAYVGEPLLMTTTWLIGKKTRGGAFSLPVLEDQRFITSARTDLLPKDKTQLIQIELDNETILAKRYPKKVAGQDGLAITFFHTIIPQKTGEIILPQGTIALSALTGYTSPQSRRSFDPFNRFNGQREIYSTIVIPANPVTLKVLPLPTKNKPDHFSGLVGQFTIETTANPTTINVGDPIELKLTIKGETAEMIGLPPLRIKDFKTSSEPAKKQPGQDASTFTTTIRAGNEQITEIPPIPLSFFNVNSGQYETVYAKAIPITVRPTRIITAEDALGGDGLLAPAPPEPRDEAPQGIHYNYSDVGSGPSPVSGSTAMLLCLILPPLFFFTIVLCKRKTDKRQKQQRLRKRQALKKLHKELKKGEPPFEAWLRFLGNELNRPAQTITLQDIQPHLSAQPELIEEVASIFKTGEAMRYGGGQSDLDQQTLIASATRIHKVLP